VGHVSSEILSTEGEGEVLQKWAAIRATAGCAGADHRPLGPLLMKIVSTTSKQRIWAYNAPVFGVKKEIPANLPESLQIPGRGTVKDLRQLGYSEDDINQMWQSFQQDPGSSSLPSWNQWQNPYGAILP